MDRLTFCLHGDGAADGPRDEARSAPGSDSRLERTAGAFRFPGPGRARGFCGSESWPVRALPRRREVGSALELDLVSHPRTRPVRMVGPERGRGITPRLRGTGHGLPVRSPRVTRWPPM